MTRSIFTHALALYIGAGLFGGLLMAQAIPAMTSVGVAYYAATWPKQIYCARADAGCAPLTESVPGWAQGLMFDTQG